MMVRTFLALSLLTLGFAMAVAPSASAQGQSVTAKLIDCESSADQVEPLGGSEVWDCTAEVQWSYGVSDPANPVTVDIEPDPPESWMSVTVSPSSMTFLPDNSDTDSAGGTQTQEESFKVFVAVNQDAPAFQPATLPLDPTLSAPYSDGEVQNPNEQGTEISVEPGYYNAYNVILDQRIGEGSPDSTVTFPITIDNFSNGDTRFSFELSNEDNLPSGFQTALPSPFMVRSLATGADTTETQVNFEVFTPYKNGYVNRIASIGLDIDSVYNANQDYEGFSSRVSTLTKVKGFYVPGPGAALTTVGMLGVALALAKGRDRELLG